MPERVREAHLPVSGSTPAYRVDSGVVSVVFPSIDLHEEIAFDLA